jgi:fatty-acid peroxygenase
MPVPRERQLDSTIALLREGYCFIQRRCERFGSDIFRSRLMLHPVTCVRGAAAAKLLYDADRFTRRRANPKPTLKLLQDAGSVQLLDGPAHRARKQMFMAMMEPARIQHLADLVAATWRAHLLHWERMDSLVLFPEVQGILCRAVCAWAGIPLDDAEAARRTQEFAAMIDGAGSVGIRNWRGLLLRQRTERWARGVVARVRAGALQPPPGTAAHLIAHHRGADGRALDIAVAAVELLNVLRPTVAVANYIVFAALALHEYADEREKLRGGGEAEFEHFAQEVRRFYPFFPFIGGRVREPFHWNGQHFRAGEWVLLDLYGTDHDARLWPDPETFRPDRFATWNGDPNTLIPQGGGDAHTGHRCPGERITIELIKTAVRLLATEMRYDVPPQDLGYSLSRLPAVPRSRFVIATVRRSPSETFPGQENPSPAMERTTGPSFRSA